MMKWVAVLLIALATPAVGQITPPPPHPSASIPRVVASGSQAAQSVDVSQPSLYPVPVSGMYRVSCFIVLTQAATTSSTMPSCSVTYTEAATGVAVSDQIFTCGSCTTNTVGLHLGGTSVIQAQAASNIGYSTNAYASSGATPMQYRVDVKIEALQ